MKGRVAVLKAYGGEFELRKAAFLSLRLLFQNALDFFEFDLFSVNGRGDFVRIGRTNGRTVPRRRRRSGTTAQNGEKNR